MKEIAELGNPKPSTPSPAPHPKPAEPPQPTPDPTPDPSDAPPADVPPQDTPTAASKPTGVNTLRKAYEQLKASHAKLSEEHERLKSSPKDDPEKAALVKTMEAKDAEIKRLTEELNFTAYERSPEYEEKYNRPFIAAFEGGRKRTESLKIVERRDENGAVVQTGRQATAQDFDQIMQIQNDEQAATVAQQLFGNAGMIVLAQRERVIEQLQNARMAAENFRKNGQQRATDAAARAAAEKARAAEESQVVAKIFNDTRNAIAEAEPDIYAIADGDTEGNAMRHTGQAVAALAFGMLSQDMIEHLPPAVKARVHNGTLPKQDLARLHAETFQRAAAYGLVRNRLKQANAKIEELQKALDQIKSSGPGGDGARHQQSTSPAYGPEAWRQEINAMAAQNRR